MIDLSILIASVHTRYETFGKAIQDQIWHQLASLPPEDQRRVEVIMLTDNKSMMLGHKRNCMVDISQGRYLAFVDDDDKLASDYLSALLEATKSDADVITFQVMVSMNGDEPKVCRYSIHYEADRNTDTGYERLPNHLCAVKRELALKSSFPNLLYGEDSGYSKLLRPHLKTQHEIPRPLYHYVYDTETTETQQHLSASLRRRQGPPIVDVVFLSNAKTKKLQGMTQNAIRTCVAGANSLPVNVIVMEQQPGRKYAHATVVQAPQVFNYNRNANFAAGMGTAEWIMIANNDIIFEDGWLHQLLVVDHPVVSPKCPDDVRQAHITENTLGEGTAIHFSGWCFMIKRTLWEKIGGFDEDFSWWCADDSVIQQVLAEGVTPMVVPGSRVHHLGGVSFDTLVHKRHHDDMTWKMIDLFNTKYGQHRFDGDPRFEKWKETHGHAR